ncbi:MAG: formylglycine-generating enzyme family protein, partial [Myxococcota bacterium]
ASCPAEQLNPQSIRPYPWGEDPPTCNLVNYEYLPNSSCTEYDGKGDTDEISSRPGGNSPYGIFNLAGNASEWTYDYYSADYYSVSPASNPTGPSEGTERAVRGGGFDDSDYYTSFRDQAAPDSLSLSRGFRCARDSFPPYPAP